MNPPKQPLNVYFVMLVASAVLMLLACILMFVEFYRYGNPWEKSGIPQRVMTSVENPWQHWD
ncbi:MAG: hypothetical protein SGI77_25580 [Pirellulaceae bacterium]|nr:hypothetical protein [Pirellulaceae bacterium]